MCSLIACGTLENRGCVIDIICKRSPAFGCLADYAAVLNCLAVGTSLVNVLYNLCIVSANDHLNVCSVAAVNDVVIKKLESSRDNDCAKLVKTYHRKPNFRTLTEHHEDSVALLDSQFLEHVGNAVALLAYILKCEMSLVAVVITPDKCFLFRVFLGVYIDNVKTEVEILRLYDLEILFKVLVTVKLYSVYKSA